MCDSEIIVTPVSFSPLIVYYETLKRVLKTKPIYEFRCDERLKTKALVSSNVLGVDRVSRWVNPDTTVFLVNTLSVTDKA